MSYFVVFAMFKSVHTPPDDSPHLWEEILYYLEADSNESAIARTRELAKDSEVKYINPYGTEVAWEYVGVTALHELDDKLIPDQEIIGRFLRESEALSMMTPFDDEPN